MVLDGSPQPEVIRAACWMAVRSCCVDCGGLTGWEILPRDGRTQQMGADSRPDDVPYGATSEVIRAISCSCFTHCITVQVTRAILFEDTPCCGATRTTHTVMAHDMQWQCLTRPEPQMRLGCLLPRPAASARQRVAGPASILQLLDVAGVVRSVRDPLQADEAAKDGGGRQRVVLCATPSWHSIVVIRAACWMAVHNPR